MSDFETRMRQALFRSDCPPQARLLDFAARLLPSDENRAVREHITGCPHCRQDIADIRAAFDWPDRLADAADPAASRSVVERIVTIVVDLLAPDAPTPALQPALRGDAGGPVVLVVDPYVVSFDVGPDEGANGRRVRGSIARRDDAAEAWQKWIVQLFGADDLLTRSWLEEDGDFTLTAPAGRAGPFELILSGPDAELHLQNVPLIPPDR